MLNFSNGPSFVCIGPSLPGLPATRSPLLPLMDSYVYFELNNFIEVVPNLPPKPLKSLKLCPTVLFNPFVGLPPVGPGVNRRKHRARPSIRLVPPKTVLLGVEVMTVLIAPFLHLAFGIRSPRPPIHARRRPLQRQLTARRSTIGLSVPPVHGSPGTLQATAANTKDTNNAPTNLNSPPYPLEHTIGHRV